MSLAQRWTLVVVCAATAMLMLDIAVVNTALSAIAADLDTGLSGLQWVIDAYTLTLAATVLTAGALADRFGRRRLFLHGLAVFTVDVAAVRRGAVHRHAPRRARRAGRSARRSCSPSPWPCSRTPSRGPSSSARPSRPTARRWPARSPSARWSAARSPRRWTGAGSSSSTSRSGSPAWRSCGASSPSRAIRAPPRRPGGLRHAHRRALPARLRAAARSRGGMGERG